MKTLVAFFEIAIPDPRSSFLVASYNALTRYLKRVNQKCARRCRNLFGKGYCGNCMCQTEYFKQISAPPEPLTHL
jgi:hypothetical protein